MSTDSVADLLTRIRNALRASHKTVVIPYSKMSGSILNLLKGEGYIEDFSVEKDSDDKFEQYKVFLKYSQEGSPAIDTLKRVSKPGRRIYVRKDSLPKVRCGLGIAVISTSHGVMSDREARKQGIGGEVIATIY
ncbi:MAG: 30S ribosomal protein S8 [Deltaproteobacteria bacterium]|nr:30S ribosomal protein S8 [Deltaproteobacteria bacterium]